jgi:hypothetical protein
LIETRRREASLARGSTEITRPPCAEFTDGIMERTGARLAAGKSGVKVAPFETAALKTIADIK